MHDVDFFQDKTSVLLLTFDGAPNLESRVPCNDGVERVYSGCRV